MVSDLFQALWDFLFPAQCPLCHKYVKNKGDWCKPCLQQVCQPMRLPVPVPMQPLLAAAADKGITALLSWCEAAVPVPLHVSREQQRGFNQSERIFAEWLQVHGVPMIRALQRVRPTLPMYKLTPEERRQNIKGAFAVCAAGSVAGKRILLVDDILTTGATLCACAQELKRAGAAEVRVLVLASDHRM